MENATEKYNVLIDKMVLTLKHSTIKQRVKLLNSIKIDLTNKVSKDFSDKVLRDLCNKVYKNKSIGANKPR